MKRKMIVLVCDIGALEEVAQQISTDIEDGALDGYPTCCGHTANGHGYDYEVMDLDNPYIAALVDTVIAERKKGHRP